MKKIREDKIDICNGIASKRWIKDIKRKGRKYSPGRSASKAGFGGRYKICAPECISIYEVEEEPFDFIETLSFFEDVKGSVGRKKCFIDFSRTIRISAAATVILYSIIDQCEGCFDVAVSLPKSRRVKFILRQSNIIKRLKNRDILYHELSREDQIPVVSSSGNFYMEEILDFIQNKVYNNRMSPDVEYIYGDAVSETINNVQMHAYPRDDNGKWWLLCSVIDKNLFLAIYDCGVGMPSTVVERKWFISALRSLYPSRYEDYLDESEGFMFFKKFKDSELINMSMCGDVSGTRNSKHGQGSKSIKALVSDSVEGSLLVYSQKGLYKFSREDSEPDLYDLPKSVPGTLIQWNIELK